MYQDKGVYFYFAGGGVRQVVVYSSQANQAGKVGPKEVVPGVGAYGVRLGDSEQALITLEGIKDSHKFQGYSEGNGSIICEFKDGSRIIADLVNGKVKRLSISGKFSTPEGITERSTTQQVEKIFGKQQLDLGFKVPKNPQRAGLPVFGFIRWLIMLVLGCISALAVRFLSIRSSLSSPTRMILAATILSAFIATLGYALTSIRVTQLDADILRDIIYALAGVFIPCGIAIAVFWKLAIESKQMFLKALLTALLCVLLVGFFIRMLWLGTSGVDRFLFVTGVPMAAFTIGFAVFTGRADRPA
jgi:hypothetical protein